MFSHMSNIHVVLLKKLGLKPTALQRRHVVQFQYCTAAGIRSIRIYFAYYNIHVFYECAGNNVLNMCITHDFQQYVTLKKDKLYQESANTSFTHGWLVSAHRTFTRANGERCGLCDDVSGNKTGKDTEDQRTRYQGAREVSELISRGVY